MEKTKSLLKYKICLVCGYVGPESDSPALCYVNFTECKYCGNTEHFVIREKEENYRRWIEINVYNRKINPYYDKKKRKAREIAEYSNRSYSHPTSTPPPRPNPSTSQPKCPTCGSTHVNPISTTKRIASGLTLGIFGSSFGKSYECRDCKYKW